MQLTFIYGFTADLRFTMLIFSYLFQVTVHLLELFIPPTVVFPARDSPPLTEGRSHSSQLATCDVFDVLCDVAKKQQNTLEQAQLRNPSVQMTC